MTRLFRTSLFALLLVAASMAPLAVAARQPDDAFTSPMQWRGANDSFIADATFSSSFELFYAGPQWLRKALAGFNSAAPLRASRLLVDSAGDPLEAAYVGTLRSRYGASLFSDSPFFVSGAGPMSISTPLAPNTTGGAGLFYLGSGGNWDAVSAWGPDPNMYPNAQSAIATDLQTTNGAIVQNVVAGVALGIIDHNPTTPFNSGHMVHWNITTDNVIVLNNGLSPAQINNSQSFGITSLTIDGTAGLSLTSSVNITNSNATGLITISAPIVGNGGITVGGIGTTVLTGDNTFYGATVVNSGATLNVGGHHSLGGSGVDAFNPNGLGTSSVTVNSGGTLLFSGETIDRIKNDAPIILNGGTLNTGGLSEYTAGSVLPGMGALTLTATSTIDLGTIASIIAFADSSSAGWTGVLKILNWSGSSSGNGTDQIYFGTGTDGLTPTQLSQISFFSDAAGTNFLGFGAWAPDNDGEVVPLAPIPEPATWIGGALALGVIAFVSRHRLLSRFARHA